MTPTLSDVFRREMRERLKGTINACRLSAWTYIGSPTPIFLDGWGAARETIIKNIKRLPDPDLPPELAEYERQVAELRDKKLFDDGSDWIVGDSSSWPKGVYRVLRNRKPLSIIAFRDLFNDLRRQLADSRREAKALRDAIQTVVPLLLDVAYATWCACDNSYESYDGSPDAGVPCLDMEKMSGALDELDRLPKLPEPYIGTGVAKARHIIETATASYDANHKGEV